MSRNHSAIGKGHHPPDIYSAPRRFDLATMLVVTSAFALLFTGMTVLDFPLGIFIYFSSLIVFVGIAQSISSVDGNPRTASIVSAVLFHLLLILFCLFSAAGAFKIFSDRWRVEDFVCVSVVGFFTSPILGYLCGVLVAGTFLIADKLRGLLKLLQLSRTPADTEPEVISPWDTDELE